MPVWQWFADAAGVVLVPVLAYGLLLFVRHRLIARSGGTFDLSVRVRASRPGRGWVLGVGRYSGPRLECFRVFSLAPRPKVVLERTDLAFQSRRDVMGAEAYTLHFGHVIARCLTSAGPLEIAMSPQALTGFLAWLESAPPGEGLALP